MTENTPPPSWLRWADTAGTRGVTTVVAIIALIGAIVLGLRQQAYISCVHDQQVAAARRTTAVASATDRERAAQRELLESTSPADMSALRRAVLHAYDTTDRVRADNPPPPIESC